MHLRAAMEAARRGDREVGKERQPLGLTKNGGQLFAGGTGEGKGAERPQLDHTRSGQVALGEARCRRVAGETRGRIASNPSRTYVRVRPGATEVGRSAPSLHLTRRMQT